MLIAFGFLNAAIAQEPEPSQSVGETPSVLVVEPEPFSTGWGIVFDNDLLSPPASDRDYTGGFAFRLGGSRVANYPVSLDPALTWFNKLLHWDGGRYRTQQNHLMQFGLTLFTPRTDLTGDATLSDRPFANLLFLENSQFGIDESTDRSYQSTLTVGILGSGVGEVVQDFVHELGDFAGEGDYDKQISDGGELTARYAISRQTLLLSRFTSRDNAFELKYRIEGDIGYITEGSATVAARWGQIDSPWWGFAPSRSNYLPQTVPMSQHKSAGRDFYLWGAVTVRARAYNAFLQGQFRDSEVTFSGGQLNHVLGELSIGLTRRFGNNIEVSAALHHQTNEIKHGTGARHVRWGGLTISKSF